MSTEEQEKFFKCVLNATDRSTLAPLTALFTQSEYPIFVNSFFVEGLSFEDRFAVLMSVMKEASDHQSYFSTDIRYIVLCYQIFSGKLQVLKETIDELKLYPNITHEDERMRYIRPSIRASEIVMPFDILGIDNSDYLKKFWEIVSKMSDCKLSNMTKIVIYKKQSHIFYWTRVLYQTWYKTRCFTVLSLTILSNYAKLMRREITNEFQQIEILWLMAMPKTLLA